MEYNTAGGVLSPPDTGGQTMRYDDIIEMVASYNSELVDGEEVMTFTEMEEIVSQ